jgi:hypothetical protein
MKTKTNPLSDLVFHVATPYSRTQNADPEVRRKKCVAGFNDQQALAAAMIDDAPLPKRNGKRIRPSFRKAKGKYEVALRYGSHNLNEGRGVLHADDLNAVIAIFDKAIKAVDSGFLDSDLDRVGTRKSAEPEQEAA